MSVKAVNPTGSIRDRMNRGDNFAHDHAGDGTEIGDLLANKLRTHRIIVFASNTAPTAAHVGEAVVPAAGTVVAYGLAWKASTASQSAIVASFFKATGTGAGTTSILGTINNEATAARLFARRKATVNGTNKGVAAGQRLRVKVPTVGSSVKGGVVAFVDYLIT